MTVRRRVLLSALAMAWTGAKTAKTEITSPGIRVMAREKSLAEQFLALLNEYGGGKGRKDVALYAKGVTLYAMAKAEFDGLISELEHALGQSRAPNESAAFQETLDGAVEKRVAFTQFVTDAIIPTSAGTNKAVGGFIPTVPELVKAITDAGISIWKEFRASSEARRTEMRSELEDLRWPPFR